MTDKLKVKKKYVRVKDRRQGLAPKKRVFKDVAQGNQWTITPRQLKFVELWLTPSSETFGNAYQSAITAGFSHGQAQMITSDTLSLEWVSAAKQQLISLTPSHVIKGLEHEALHASQSRDRIKALELIGKLQGQFIERTYSHVDVQFINDVPRPIIDVEPTPQDPQLANRS